MNVFAIRRLTSASTKIVNFFSESLFIGYVVFLFELHFIVMASVREVKRQQQENM